MKFKSLLLVALSPVLSFSQTENNQRPQYTPDAAGFRNITYSGQIIEQKEVIAPPVIAGTPSAGTPGANGGVIKPAAAPVAVKPAPAQPKGEVEVGGKGAFTYTPTAPMR